MEGVRQVAIDDEVMLDGAIGSVLESEVPTW